MDPDDIERLTHAMFIAQGYEDAFARLPPCTFPHSRDTERDTLSRHVGGQLELLRHLARFTPLLHALYNREQDHPGVFDYSVSAPFGACFAEETMSGRFPTDEWCQGKITELAIQFYKDPA